MINLQKLETSLLSFLFWAITLVIVADFLSYYFLGSPSDLYIHFNMDSYPFIMIFNGFSIFILIGMAFYFKSKNIKTLSVLFVILMLCHCALWFIPNNLDFKIIIAIGLILQILAIYFYRSKPDEEKRFK